MLPKNILVPTDLSDGAEEALDYACELAQKLDATLHIVHVIGVPALGVPELGVAITSSVVDSLIHDDQAALDKLAAARRGPTKIGEVLLRSGDARDTIDQVAKEVSADLIVMATHGRRGLSRALLGSITEAVIRTAPSVGRSSVPIRCRSVDLPEPDGPTIPTNSPRRTLKLTPWRAITGGSAG